MSDYNEINTNKTASEIEAALNEHGNSIPSKTKSKVAPPKNTRGAQEAISNTNKDYLNKKFENYTDTDWDNYLDDSHQLVRLENYENLRGNILPSDPSNITPNFEELTGPEYEYMKDWGKSMYDNKYYIGQPTYDVLKDDRSNNQPGWVQFAAGVGKGVTTMFTTAVSGSLGFLYGAVKAGVDRELSSLWDNEVTQAMQSLEKGAEELMPNYTTVEEDENPLRWNMFLTANFWGNDIIKNMGFMVGAFVGGLPITKALKFLGKGYQSLAGARKLSKLNSRAANRVKTINSILEKNANGRAIGSFSKAEIQELTKDGLQKAGLTDADLAKYYKDYYERINKIARTTKSVSTLIGSTVQAVGEGSIEALNSAADYKEAKFMEIENDAMQKRERLKHSGLSPEEIEKQWLDIDAEEKKKKEAVEASSKNLGNATLLMNLPILTASNLIQFSKLYAADFSKYSSMFSRTNRIAKGLVTNEAGELVSNKSIMKGIGKTFSKTFLAEGHEEFAQRAASDAAKEYAEKRYERILAGAKSSDESAMDDVSSYLSSFASTYIKNTMDESAWKEFFVGGLSSLIGMPTFGKHSNHSAYLGKDKSVGLSGGAIGEFRDYMEDMNRENAIGKAWAAIEKDPTKVKMLENLIQHSGSEKRLRDALLRGDKKLFKDEEHDDLVNTVLTAAYAGKLNELKAMLGFNEDLTDDELEEIANETKHDVTVGEEKQRIKTRMAEIVEHLSRGAISYNQVFTEDIFGEEDKTTNPTGTENYERVRKSFVVNNEQLEKEFNELAQEYNGYKGRQDDELTGKSTGEFVDATGSLMKPEEIRKQIKSNVESIGKAIDDIVETMVTIDEDSSGTLKDEDVATLTKLKMAMIDQEYRLFTISQDFIENMFPTVKKTFESLKDKYKKDLEELEKKTNRTEKENDEIKQIKDSIEKNENIERWMDQLSKANASDIENLFIYNEAMMRMAMNIGSLTHNGFYYNEAKRFEDEFNDALLIAKEKRFYRNKFNELIGNPNLISEAREATLSRMNEQKIDALVEDAISEISKQGTTTGILNVLMSNKYPSDVIDKLLTMEGNNLAVLETSTTFQKLKDDTKKFIREILKSYKNLTESYDILIKYASEIEDENARISVINIISNTLKEVINDPDLQVYNTPEGMTEKELENRLSESFIDILESVSKDKEFNKEHKEVADIINEIIGKYNLSRAVSNRATNNSRNNRSGSNPGSNTQSNIQPPSGSPGSSPGTTTTTTTTTTTSNPSVAVTPPVAAPATQAANPTQSNSTQEEECKKAFDELAEKIKQISDDDHNNGVDVDLDKLLEIRSDLDTLYNNFKDYINKEDYQSVYDVLFDIITFIVHNEGAIDNGSDDENKTTTTEAAKQLSTASTNFLRSDPVTEFQISNSGNSQAPIEYNPTNDLDRAIQEEMKKKENGKLSMYDINNIGIKTLFKGNAGIRFIKKNGNDDYLYIAIEYSGRDKGYSYSNNLNSISNTSDGKSYVLVGILSSRNRIASNTYNNILNNISKAENPSNADYIVSSESIKVEDIKDEHIGPGRLRLLERGEFKTTKELLENGGIHTALGPFAVGVDGAVDIDDENITAKMVTGTIKDGAIYLYTQRADGKYYPIYVFKRTVSEVLEEIGDNEDIFDNDSYLKKIKELFEFLQNCNGKDFNEILYNKMKLISYFTTIPSSWISVNQDNDDVSATVGYGNIDITDLDFKTFLQLLSEDFNDDDGGAVFSIPIGSKRGIEENIDDMLHGTIAFKIDIENYLPYNSNFFIPNLDENLKEDNSTIIIPSEPTTERDKTFRIIMPTTKEEYYVREESGILHVYSDSRLNTEVTDLSDKNSVLALYLLDHANLSEDDSVTVDNDGVIFTINKTSLKGVYSITYNNDKMFVCKIAQPANVYNRVILESEDSDRYNKILDKINQIQVEKDINDLISLIIEGDDSTSNTGENLLRSENEDLIERIKNKDEKSDENPETKTSHDVVQDDEIRELLEKMDDGWNDNDEANLIYFINKFFQITDPNSIVNFFKNNNKKFDRAKIKDNKDLIEKIKNIIDSSDSCRF